ncbi:hypothetical protein BH10PLA1_BH10PLA1_00350 [soil metagenome]
MRGNSFIVHCSSFIVLLLLSLAGCGDVVQQHNTALDSVDLITMTDDMATKIAADPDVQAAIANKGALKIVVQPVVNQMTGEVLPRGQAETFTSRVRVLLARHRSSQFVWIMNRDYFHYLQGKELELGPNPESTNPEYALTATFSSLTNESAERRSSYYLCTYELTNLMDRTLLWGGKYEVKKAISKGYLD